MLLAVFYGLAYSVSMKTMTTVALACLTCIGMANAKAPAAQIQAIKEVYQKTNALIAATEKSAEAAKASPVSVDHYITNALNRSWEGVGNYKVTYKFYYTHDAPSGENHLLKISQVTESAARKYHEEFYYNSTGQLVFYYQKTNDTEQPKERRIYFHKGKAIRLIDDQFSRDGYTDGDREMVGKIRQREKVLKLKFTSR